MHPSERSPLSARRGGPLSGRARVPGDKSISHRALILAAMTVGESTVAALLARSFAELTRFGLAFGARPETLAGLSGLGDLILTGTSSRSRNRRIGEELGRGIGLETAIADVGLAEGVWTAPILADMARKRHVDMPIAAAVSDLVAGKASIDQAIKQLLSRPPRAE